MTSMEALRTEVVDTHMHLNRTWLGIYEALRAEVFAYVEARHKGSQVSKISQGYGGGGSASLQQRDLMDLDAWSRGGGKGQKGQLRQRCWKQQWRDWNAQQHNKGKSAVSDGKAKGKGGSKGENGVPREFLGKATWCSKHAKKICFDHHLQNGGCRNWQCEMCHDALRSPTMRCDALRCAP